MQVKLGDYLPGEQFFREHQGDLIENNSLGGGVNKYHAR